MRPLAAASLPLALALLAAACSKSPEGPVTVGPVGSATAVSHATSAPLAASAAPAAAGPTASIPAGKLTAGTACGDHPKLPGEELAGEAVDLGAFDIDAYPYPNDPGQPPATNVSRDDAKKLCEARGRRLCSELEWERACKGPASWRYEYGDRFDAKACPSGHGPVPAYASFEKCVSGFGVHAMHGFDWEWTASDWKRGKEEGRGVLRGGFGNQPFAHDRCSAVRAAEPATKEAVVGFRCCGGAPNGKEVVIPADDPAPAAMAPEPTVDEALTGRLKRALVNGAFKDSEGVTSTFGAVWRWHPAPKEEILVVRLDSKTEGGAAFVQPLLVRLCDKSVQLIGRLKGPVEKMDDPRATEDAPGTAVIHVDGFGSSGDVKLAYQFAQVAIDAPAWIKAGTLPAASASAVTATAPAAPPTAPPTAAASAAPAAAPAPK
jgi:sulfatase modifying factor 1